MKITKFKNGELTRKKEGSSYTSVLLTESKLSIVNGSVQQQKRVAAMPVPDEIIPMLGTLSEGMDINAKMVALGLGKVTIQRVKTLKEQWPGQTVAVNPETGEEMSYYLSFRVAPIGTADVEETTEVTAEMPTEAGDLA